MFIRTPYHNHFIFKKRDPAHQKAIREMVAIRNDEKQPSIDDSHKRWSNASTYQAYVWDYFCNHVVKQIIVNGLKEKISFSHLFKQLSVARAKCEWMKNLEFQLYSVDTISMLLKHNIDMEFPKGFGSFQYGNSREGDILNEKGYWGATVAKFSQQRIKNNETTGLSRIKVNSGKTFIYHPFGSILTKLENDFKKLCSTTNFFDFLKIAARMSFMISNFPPVTRGSAAITSWLIDGIAQKKFGLTSSIRPLLYDWTAFYETADQYTAYYIISAALLYVQSLENISVIIPELKILSKTIQDLMQQRPDDIEVSKARARVWSALKYLLAKNLSQFEGKTEYKILSELLDSHLTFNPVSDIAISIAKKYAINNTGANLSPEETEYLNELTRIHSRMASIYLAAFGNQDEENRINLIWADCGFLLDNGISLTNQVLLDNERKVNIGSLKCLENEIIKNGYIDFAHTKAFENLLTMIREVDSKACYAYGRLDTLSHKIVVALNNGMQLEDLNDCFLKHGLTLSHIEILTNHAAILLYNSQPGMKLENLLYSSSENRVSPPSPESVEMNILRLLSEHYFIPEKLGDIADQNTRTYLLKFSAIPCFQNKLMSQLIGGSGYETAKNILCTYLEMECSIKNPESLISGFDERKIIAILKGIMSLQQDKLPEDKLLQAASILILHGSHRDTPKDTIMRAAFYDPDTYKGVIHLLLGRHNMPLDAQSQQVFDEYLQLCSQKKGLIF